jgi:alkyl hydroperoxide reductase subunit AhpC
MLMVGQKAPDFTLDAVVGKGDFKKISLEDFKGKWVVLFFYPLDFTFVCPTEIQEFSKREGEFKKLNTVVLGASVDSKYSHKEWINGNLGVLGFPLLSDMSREVTRKYGALVEEADPRHLHRRSERRAAVRALPQHQRGPIRERDAARAGGDPDGRQLPGGVEARREDPREVTQSAAPSGPG